MSPKKTDSVVDGITVRNSIIEWFYRHNKRGRAALGMRDLCKGIKDELGYKSPLVKEHLTYLVDLNYISKETVMTKIQTGRTSRDQPRTSYRISAKGIEYIEGRSDLSEKDRYPGINITATGGSNVVLGDGNVVNSQYTTLHHELTKLSHAVADSTELNDTSKLIASVNIETIKDQLALPEPDRTITERAWDTIERMCTTANLIEHVARIAPLLGSIF
ncbi:MAG: hypothetical protein ACF8PN_15115 [Phycisphaerales bacterium]